MMKIGGPKGPKPGAPSKAPLTPAEAKGASFQKILDSSEAESSASMSTIAAEVAAQLRGGDLTKAQAAEALIDSIVQTRAGDLAPATQRELREALASLLASDPVLRAQLDRLDPDG